MTQKQKILINLIVVALLGVITVGWVLFRLVGTGVLEKPMVVTADFAASGGVFTNQEVTYRGVTIGKVGTLRLNDDGVEIDLVIDPEWRDRVPADVTARIGSKSAVGEQFVNLTPNSRGDEMLADGDVIARTRTELPVDFQELLSSLDAVLSDIPPGKTRRLVENLADGLEGRAEDIGTVLRSLGVLSEAFASVAEEQRRLLDSSTTVGEEFLRTKDNFARAIEAADRVFAGIGDEPEELRAFLAENDRLAREGIALLARRGRDLRAGVSALADFTTFQLDERDSVKQSLQHVPEFLKAVEEASVPWEAPDGRTFYRIRVGLVIDQENRASWPCKYRRRDEYHRHYFVRERKTLRTDTRCLPGEDTQAAREALAALREWVDNGGLAEEERPGGPDVSLILGPSGYQATEISFAWPLQGPVTSGFGPRGDELHQGIDIGGAEGDAIVTTAPGRVITAGYHSGGYGNVVALDHGDGFTSVYAHLSEIAVRAGDEVDAGHLVGLVGCTGRCSGDHLHFEIRLEGKPVDPLLYLPGGILVPREAAETPEE